MNKPEDRVYGSSGNNLEVSAQGQLIDTVVGRDSQSLKNIPKDLKTYVIKADGTTFFSFAWCSEFTVCPACKTVDNSLRCSTLPRITNQCGEIYQTFIRCV